jgi:diamine N-acetyltransferase
MLISVEQATPDDAETISRLATLTFNETYAWYNTPENMNDYTHTHFSVAQTRAELRQADTHFFLARVNHVAAGYAKIRNAEHPPELAGKRYCEVERIYVLKQFQKAKVGYALITECIDLARRLDLDTLWLGVWEKNESALRFYEKVGFRKFGRHIFRLGTDEQEDYLVKFDLK